MSGVQYRSNTRFNLEISKSLQYKELKKVNVPNIKVEDAEEGISRVCRRMPQHTKICHQMGQYPCSLLQIHRQGQWLYFGRAQRWEGGHEFNGAKESVAALEVIQDN